MNTVTLSTMQPGDHQGDEAHSSAPRPDMWKVGEADIAPYVAPILQAKPDCLLIGTARVRKTLTSLKLAKPWDIGKQLAVVCIPQLRYQNLQALGKDAPEVYGHCELPVYYPETPENKTFVRNEKNV